MALLKNLNVKEWVTIIYFGWVISISTIFRDQLPTWYVFIIGHSVGIALIIWLSNQAWFAKPGWRFWKDNYPYFIALLGYIESANFITLISQTWYDNLLVKIDFAIFQAHPTVWLAEHGNMFLNECANFAYFAYFVYVPILAIILWRRNDSAVYERFLGGLVMAYNFSYVFFVLLPASSPRFALPEFGLIAADAVRLKGYLFTSIIDSFMDGGAMRGGAFPSVHCGASTVFLLNVYLHGTRKWFIVSLVLVLGMYWSTVYGRYHYVIDVLVGIVFGIIFTWISHVFQKKIENMRQ